MPAQVNYGTVGATGGGFSARRGLQPWFAEERLDVRPGWSWQRRSAKTWRDPNQWRSLWSFGCKVNGGAIQEYAVDGQSGYWGYETFSCDGPGQQSKRFIRGVTKDSGGTPISGCTVQGFVTSTDAYVGEDVSRDDGTYLLGTDTLPGVAHYLVAYKPGSPDIAGTTVNTITSTYVDGTT